ncbi:MAG: carboxymuconolactone decarboxylase family protein [Rhodospirillales bacterium]
MPRIQTVDSEQTEGRVKDLLNGVNKKLGMVPNLLKTLAHAPAALEYYVAGGNTLAGGLLDAKLRERIMLAVAGENGCDYCASAHTLLAKKAGIDDRDLVLGLKGESADATADAALKFAKAVIAARGKVTDADIEAVRKAGYGDGEITEIVANIAFGIYTNYFNHVADTEIDFPVVRTQAKAAA